MRPHLLAPLLLALAVPSLSAAQAPSTQRYLHYIPAQPRVIGETEASVRFRLFGDPSAPGYRDAAPRDGVDDRRAERLLRLAERFSPLLRRNTRNVPREVEEFLGERLVLHVDRWRDDRLVAGERLDLGPSLRPGAGATDGYRSTALAAPDDGRLSELYGELNPDRTRPLVARPEGETETVLYIDFPGEEEASWRRALGRRAPERSRIYMHPFVAAADDSSAGPRYQLVLQYWLFYPYNDGANNHEGDWEHLNVSVTTRERAGEHAPGEHPHGLLTAADVEAILRPDAPTALDSLVIRSVAYYFHNNVMTLDYLAISAGEPQRSQLKSDDGAVHVWEDTSYVAEALRRRMALADGRLATHPIGYIGGNNKGLDELLEVRPRFLGSFNRDSHGTYPFPGVWRRVGPVDATEKIWGDVVPTLRRDAGGRVDPAAEWHQLIDDERYLVYRADDIVLLPDWERLLPAAEHDAEVRRRWAWFLLPVRLGYPATTSPGAGALRRVDLGNVSPLGPAYNDSWNRPGATSVYQEYTPTVLRVAFAPITPLASLQSGWGILNYPLLLWGLMPGGNVAITQLLPWVTGGLHLLGAPPAKTFVLGDLPMRFTSVGVGVFRSFGGRDFARLLPRAGAPEVRSFVERNAASGARPGRWSSREWGTRAWLNLYYGPRLSVENTFGLATADVAYPILDAGDGTLATVEGVVETRELTGGLAYRLPPTTSDALRLYVRAGYGYTDYSLRRVSLAGTPLADADLEGGYMLSLLPSRRWWPNSFYGGVGVELFSPPRRWLLRRLGYGARLEVNGLLHRLQAQGECDECHVTAERGDVALMVHFAW